ncbi:MAG: SAM-dependent methyltransferase [Armatimonadetes bacterium]|nr:SAM-dependent methyltransferase [Akkermansiaceae bacterium]
MPDITPQAQSNDCSCPENYPNPPDSATPTLIEKILCKIALQGPLSFPEYLEIALYDPISGYYAGSSQRIGRNGDFYTSVSVGPLFGQLLARHFLNWWENNHRPRRWRILEIGANDGRLAEDIITALHAVSPPAWQSLEYAILEPLPGLRAAQQDRLKNLPAKLRVSASLTDLQQTSLPGIAFANEVLDALPFHLVKRMDQAWQELYVNADSCDRLFFSPSPIAPDSSLAARLAKLGEKFPDGYQTEVRTNFGAFLESVSSCLLEGSLIFFDYGFAAPEYYEDSRSNGTLRTYSNHQAGENPLLRPGEADITAHVDFTDLAMAARKLDFHPTGFSTQGSFLTHLARPMMLNNELSDPKAIARFQSLTHPAHLGSRFHVIEFSSKGESPSLIKQRLAL